MRVWPKPITRDPAGRRLASAAIDVGGGVVRDIRYRVADRDMSQRSDGFLTACLIPAMKAGGQLHVEGTVSPRLAHAVPEIESVLLEWYPDLKPVDLRASSVLGVDSGPGRGSAAFFSGGVDSFFTALQHLDEISALVFVHGFDIELRAARRRSNVSLAVREAATELGKPLIEVETDVRSFSDPYAPWSERYHGAALASVAHLLGAEFSRFYIPATFSASYVDPWGSHPRLDPLWSSNSVEVVHDGFEATRLQKVAVVAQSEIALRWLRVCWQGRDGEYNCGHCEKCVRTMVNLELVGGLDRCRTFAHTLDLRRVARTWIPDACARVFVEENMAECDRLGTRPLLRQALKDSLGGRPIPFIEALSAGELAPRVVRRLRRTLGLATHDWTFADDAFA